MRRHHRGVLLPGLLLIPLILATACGGSNPTPTDAATAEAVAPTSPPVGMATQPPSGEASPAAEVPEEPPKAPFQGTLVAAADGAPIAGALMIMCPIIDIETSVCIMDESMSAVTDEAGVFSFDAIYVGLYMVLYDPTNSAASSEEFWQFYQYHRVHFASQTSIGSGLEIEQVGYFGNVVESDGGPPLVQDGAIVYAGLPWLVYEFDAEGKAVVLEVPTDDGVTIRGHVTAANLNR